MTRVLIIIACLISLYGDYFVHDWNDWLVLARLAGCIVVYCLCLNVKGYDLALCGIVLLLSFYELLDELYKRNTELFITDIFINIIAISYLIIKWQKSKTKY